MVKTKILLVEDDKSLREIYGVRLYSEGYDIISAGDGEEALAMAIKERPTLIISDVMMPKISGFDMLDILRSTTETKNIKVIMMTALSSEDQRARGEALGADRYLVKSQVGIEDVVRTVHEVLGDALVSGAPSSSPVFAAPAPSAPAAAPAPIAATAPVIPGAPQAPEGILPQPTAPFSTNRPANLGDRVIHPLTSSEPAKDFNAMMSAELSSTPQPSVNPVAGAEPELAAPDLESLIPPIPATAFEQGSNTTQPSTPVIDTPPVYPPTAGATEAAPPVEPAPSAVPQIPTIPEPQASADSDVPVVPMSQPVDDSGYPVSALPPATATAAAPAPVPTIEQPSQPPQMPAGVAYEETPYAPNPVVPVAPAGDQPGTDEPPLVVPPRSTSGV